ncbi:MAG: amidase [Paracoccaceae bacterium]|jgi:amidase
MGEIWQMTASEIATALRKRKLSANEVAKAHLARLDQVNPSLNAVVQVFPEETLALAQAVDDAIAKGIDPGPLAGVPVTTKVNVDQVGHATTNGLVIQKNLIAKADNPVVANLKAAGGVIVGRTNTPAFSLRWFTKNNLHGQTFNPHNKNLTPGGSSGGAAAAVASGICAIGHGTDIGGSVRYPAYACGLHGLRPTLGRIPAYNSSAPDRYLGGQIMAVSGPIARSIADIKLALEAMSAASLLDPWYVPVPLDMGDFPKRAALCVAPDGMDVRPEVETALREAAQKMVDDGWQVDEVAPPSFKQPAEINGQLWLAEMRRGALPMFEREDDAEANFVLSVMMKRSNPVDANGLLDAFQLRTTCLREWGLFLAKYSVLICPTSGELPFTSQADQQSETRFNAIMDAQLTQIALPALGLPGLALATGFSETTPVGVQLIAGRFREDILLEAGAVIEKGLPDIKPVTPNF